MQIKNRYTNELIKEIDGDSLVRANLWGADLRRADLQGADLQGADLRRAKISSSQKDDLLKAMGVIIID